MSENKTWEKNIIAILLRIHEESQRFIGYLTHAGRLKDFDLQMEALDEHFKQLKLMYHDEKDDEKPQVLTQIDVVNISNAIHDEIYIELKKDLERIALLLEEILKQVRKC